MQEISGFLYSHQHGIIIDYRVSQLDFLRVIASVLCQYTWQLNALLCIAIYSHTPTCVNESPRTGAFPGNISIPILTSTCGIDYRVLQL